MGSRAHLRRDTLNADQTMDDIVEEIEEIGYPSTL